ncbi:MAG: N-formylglutamate deformylase [Gammaproteobacteria bacterium]|jgi:N-formylglutamate deformylase
MMIDINQGDSPLILAQPHGGTEVPESIWPRLNETGQALADPDWHISKLYAGLLDDVTSVSTRIHRYVIDANRNPSDESLYPGQNTTGLCPTTTFDGIPIYKEGESPSPEEVNERQQQYHQPYHDALRNEIERIKQKHGYVILYDCHSIRSNIPYLFEGRLPDFNIGTVNGTSCDPSIENNVLVECQKADLYSNIINGRFKGGWTTRHYGIPAENYHAIQMELTQSTYMQEFEPWDYDPDKASKIRPVLASILKSLLNALPS